MHTIADLHTHTLVSQHAYSTLYENIQAAREADFYALAVTDHGPGMPDGASSHHFFCLSGLPETVNGIRLFKGAEVNIMDFSGKIDLESETLQRLDFVIASYHCECIIPGTKKENTAGFLAVIQNPFIDCLGHCGNPAYPIDIPAVVHACRQHSKLIEINSSSFRIRPGSKEICRKVAKECISQKVKLLISSDAHFRDSIGSHKEAIHLLEELNCPEDLVINTSKERLLSYFTARHNRLADRRPL